MLVAWYAFERFPRSCVVCGIGEGLMANFLACACPAIEIYGVDRWEGIVAGNPAITLSYDFAALDHRGRVHYLNGEPSTAAARLQAAYGKGFHVDLMTLVQASQGLDYSYLLPLSAPS